jgi:hypothetical protein
MRKFLTLFISSYVLLLEAAYAQLNMAYPAEVLNSPLNKIQFKSTHNSYKLGNSPKELIDDYNVWELELDFGIINDPSQIIVGHDGPEPKFGLRLLKDWVSNAKTANALQYHPVILKLEAKTQDSCGDPSCIFCCWGWTPVERWGKWQQTLTNDLLATIGLENWITRSKFENDYHSTWPSAKELAGKFIISLQDNNNGRDIQDPASTYFFIGGVPLGAFGPINNPSDMGRALKSDASRLVFDGGYKEPWSNVLVHSPLPSAVNSSHKGWQWGTAFQPFQTIGHAINASWMHDGGPTTQIIALNAGNYDEKVTISTPVEFRTPLGSVTIGGRNVSYTITLSVMDVPEAGTNSPVYMRLHGVNGSTGDYLLENPRTYFDRAGVETFWITAADVGVLQSITIGVQGSDDVYIDDIIVVSASTGRKSVHAGAWIGDDNGSPKTFNF